ncbi:Uncharacterised protein [uncultured archaeon]|nr:Uncharacterised protein [uncultured archaeon]
MALNNRILQNYHSDENRKFLVDELKKMKLTENVKRYITNLNQYRRVIEKFVDLNDCDTVLEGVRRLDTKFLMLASQQAEGVQECDDTGVGRDMFMKTEMFDAGDDTCYDYRHSNAERLFNRYGDDRVPFWQKFDHLMCETYLECDNTEKENAIYRLDPMEELNNHDEFYMRRYCPK